MGDTQVKPAVRRARDQHGRALRWADAKVTVRADAATGAPHFHGEAIVFNEWTWIGSKRYGFRERIAPGAVDRALQEDDVRFLINHDPNLLLARNVAGTLTLTATDGALEVDADLPDISYARDLAVSLERGDVTGMSFAFEILSETYSEGEDGAAEYTINELRLYDVSVVTYPAYETTSAGLRAEAFELMCRSVGLDQKAERHLLRELTGADDEILDETFADKVRTIVEAGTGGVRAGEPSDDGPGGDPADDASRAGGNPDGADTTNGNTPDGIDVGATRRRMLARRTDASEEK